MITNYCAALLFLINVVFISGETFPEETTGVELPSGHVQFYRVYASGYQNYICTMDSSETWHWFLDHPVAVLRRYNAPDLNPEVDPIVGNHQHTLTQNFTINTAIWILGTNCQPTTCDSITDKLHGTPIKTNDNKPGQALPKVLFQTLTDEENIGLTFKDVTYIQRLDIVNGVVPVTEKCTMGTNGSHYNANYTAHYIFAHKTKARGLPIDTKTLAEAIDNVEDTYSLYADYFAFKFTDIDDDFRYNITTLLDVRITSSKTDHIMKLFLKISDAIHHYRPLRAYPWATDIFTFKSNNNNDMPIPFFICLENYKLLNESFTLTKNIPQPTLKFQALEKDF
ncbi:unnamed protein product [Rotaria sp. Silwood2]|nr:unnamed protein product [Rotaria sp. Silwood2]